MNREIKFRFYNPHFDKIFYGEEHFDGDRWYNVTGLGDIHTANAPVYDMADEGVIPMQCIGMKDKNGKEIWEGDIVKYIFDQDACNEEGWELGAYEIGKVIFYAGSFRYQFKDKPQPIWDSIEGKLGEKWDEFEVIGNVFENPELLDKPFFANCTD